MRKPDSNVIVSVWHPVGPPGYQPLGDVITLGLDPPTAPVQVWLCGSHTRKGTDITDRQRRTSK